MKPERGFSLLELMIALAVFATLAGAVATASQRVLRQNLRVEEKLLAAWVLDNHMTEHRLRGGARPGKTQYQVPMGRRQWQVFEVISMAEPGLVQIELAVRAGDSRAVIHSLAGRLAVTDE